MMFGQVLVMYLFGKRVLAQICGNNFMIPQAGAAPKRKCAATRRGSRRDRRGG
jgi:hypothetical protein